MQIDSIYMSADTIETRILELIKTLKYYKEKAAACDIYGYNIIKKKPQG